MPRTKKEIAPEEETPVQEEQILADPAERDSAEGDVSTETEPEELDGNQELLPPEAEGEEADADGPRRRLRAKKTRHVVTIDDHRTAVSDNDRANEKMLDLVESMKAGRILTDTVQGVEMSETGERSRAVLYHGDFKILIPDTEFVRLPENLNNREPAGMLHAMTISRLGAEVDYVVKGMDPENRLAVASRLQAMRMRSRRHYQRETQAGVYLVRPGKLAEARVVAVLQTGIFMDVLGVETFVPLEELSYQRIWDASRMFQSGQRILVRILEIERSDLKNIRVTVSVKQAGVHPFVRSGWKFKVGECYVGRVSMVDFSGVFVSLDGGVDCLCGYPARGRPPRGARVTVRILGIEPETNRIWGAITHVSAARLDE